MLGTLFLCAVDAGLTQCLIGPSVHKEQLRKLALRGGARRGDVGPISTDPIVIRVGKSVPPAR